MSVGPGPSRAVLLLCGLWTLLFFAAIFAPPLLDDADATHAQAARHIAISGDWTTLYVNGVRYLEKAPLPYWLVAISFRIFGFNTFAAHLPQAIAVLLLALLAFHCARKAFDDRTALYSGLAVLTSAGVFLFTRIFIPEVLLSLLLCTALYCFLHALEAESPTRAALLSPTSHAYLLWIALALAVLTKGLIALVFFFGTAIVYLTLTGQWRNLGKLKPLTGTLLFLAIAAPWHILAGLRNTDGTLLGHRHGFFWFYFINEHFLRFLGKRFPMDYNKLPGYLFWSLHLVWLFPWALFIPLPFIALYRWISRHRTHITASLRTLTYPQRTTLLLTLYSALILIFFSISTNQEYYTFPAWTPLLILIAGVVAGIEESHAPSRPENLKPMLSTAWLTGGQAVFAVVGVLAALALGWGLWDSRHLPYVADIGTLLAHRDVGNYTLSMSHLFDLTGPSFAALRLPAALAAVALLIGPFAGWLLRLKGKHLASTVCVALTMAVFLVAAHIAFARFEPMLSSKPMADTIMAKGSPSDTLIIDGDQSSGSSVIFYTNHFFDSRPALLVLPRCGQHGEGSTLLWGSCYPDAPDIFLSDAKLQAIWGTGNRKWIFAEDQDRAKVEHALTATGHLYPVQTLADKTLWTDRPLP